MTTKLSKYAESVEFYTRGLSAVSTGICPGCEQCRDEYAPEIPCPRCAGEGWFDDEANDYPDCPDCDGEGNRPVTMAEFEELWSSGEIDSEPSFSHSGCEICGSHLGGDFEVWHAVDANGEIIHGDRACVDCVMYLANGDEPEDWEGGGA